MERTPGSRPPVRNGVTRVRSVEVLPGRGVTRRATARPVSALTGKPVSARSRGTVPSRCASALPARSRSARPGSAHPGRDRSDGVRPGACRPDGVRPACGVPLSAARSPALRLLRPDPRGALQIHAPALPQRPSRPDPGFARRWPAPSRRPPSSCLPTACPSPARLLPRPPSACLPSESPRSPTADPGELPQEDLSAPGRCRTRQGLTSPGRRSPRRPEPPEASECGAVRAGRSR